MEFAFDVQRSLIELEPEAWEPDGLDEDLLAVARRIAVKPLRRLGTAELRELLVRNLALPYAAPLAIDKLAEEPFLEAQQYPGDLLTALMESDTRFWQEHEDLWWATIPLLEAAVRRMNQRMEDEERGDYLPWHMGDDFLGALMHFRGIHHGGTEA